LDIDELKKNAEFLINTLTGMEIPGSATFNIRHRNLVKFAKVYGITDPKYVGSEEEGVVACHAFANYFTVKALYKLVLGIKVEQNGKERGLVRDPGKMLHTGNRYNWEGCVNIKSGDKLKVTGKCGKVWLIEKNMILFVEFLINIKNQNNEPVCNVVITAGLRKGGY